MRQKMELSERQARVGIIANPARISLPAVVPRDTIARWPDLRSPRRLRRMGLAVTPSLATELTTHALDSFAAEMRQRRSRTGGLLAFVQQMARWPNAFVLVGAALLIMV